MASIKRQPPKPTPAPPKSFVRRCLEGCAMFLAAVVILCIVAGIIALSFVGSSEVWASPGLVIQDDDDTIFSGGSVEQGTLQTPTNSSHWECPSWTENANFDTSDPEDSFERFIASSKNGEPTPSSRCEKEVSLGDFQAYFPTHHMMTYSLFDSLLTLFLVKSIRRDACALAL